MDVYVTCLLSPSFSYVNSPEECCTACAASFACTYFTFYEGACYFKYSDYGKTNSSGSVSGHCQKTVPIPPSVNFALGCGSVPCPDDSMFSDAITAAQNSDAIVLVLGLCESIESEGNDRISLDLPGNK